MKTEKTPIYPILVHLELGGPTYKYKGFLMEIHRYHGPARLNKDGELSKRSGKKFWEAATELMQMPEDERNQYRSYE